MMPPVALIAGPTASGKSDLAVEVARNIEKRGRKTAIINADSAQVYADLSILSARPTREEMRGIAHYLFGAWDGAQACSAADWASAAKDVISTLQQQDIFPILVGGTGLYLRTLLDGIAPVPDIDPAIREAVRALPQAEARIALEREDPAAAARIAFADNARTCRALEVIRSTGETLASWQKVKTGGIGHTITLHPLILLPERTWLYERCDQRFLSMLDQGAIEEVKALLARKLDPALPVMRAIGMREIAAWLEGVTPCETMVETGQQATRNYAKRQYTWFHHQPPETWPRIEYGSMKLLNDKYREIFETLLQR